MVREKKGHAKKFALFFAKMCKIALLEIKI